MLKDLIRWKAACHKNTGLSDSEKREIFRAINQGDQAMQHYGARGYTGQVDTHTTHTFSNTPSHTTHQITHRDTGTRAQTVMFTSLVIAEEPWRSPNVLSVGQPLVQSLKYVTPFIAVNIPIITL